MKHLIFVLVPLLVKAEESITGLASFNTETADPKTLKDFTSNLDLNLDLASNFTDAIQLSTDQIQAALLNITSAVMIPSWNDLQVTIGQIILPYSIAIFALVGLIYAVISVFGFFMSSKMQLLGLASEFLNTRMPLFQENVAEVPEAARRMMTDAVYSAIDRFTQLNNDH